MNIHEKYINRCIQIAKNGLGNTAPNPMVGAVIVLHNKIIGEGYTAPFGGAHAEVNAIQSVVDKTQLKKATLYVTLEPCNHFGKTPPCTNLIIENKIPNIVIGTLDPHDKVAGKGIKKLQKAGCHVTVGVLEAACKAHHKRFLMFHKKKRPYIILKWAETADGFIAPKTRNSQKPVWISNQYSRQLVHKWRTEEQAILVGTKTVLADNPSLTAREWVGKNPIRIVLDNETLLPKNMAVFNDKAETILLTKKEIDYKLPIAKQITAYLFSKNIQSVIIEGGLQTLQTFIDENIWDEARIFYGNATFLEGTKAPKILGQLISEVTLANDTFRTYKNNTSN